MKRAYALLLALLLVFTGCTGKFRTKDISVKDVCCPYKIDYKKSMVEITLQDAEKRGVLWNVETIPENICEVTQETVEKEYTWEYLVSGKEAGTALLTFTALYEDGTTAFDLSMTVDVDSQGKTEVTSCQHRESERASVETDGLTYKWNVDLNGVLDFSFINSEDNWYVQGDGGDVCVLSNMMSTPAGCKFSANANAEGKTTVVLVGENTQRKIHVVIQTDANGKLDVISVQEQ